MGWPQENRLVATEFAKYFPEQLNPQQYRTIVHNEIDRLIAFLKQRFDRDRCIAQLSSFNIYIDEKLPESLSFVGDLRNNKTDLSELNSILEAIRAVEIAYQELLKLSLDDDDRDSIHKQQQMLSSIKDKYQNRKSTIESENIKIEIIAKTIDAVARKHGHMISDGQKKNARSF